MKHKLSTGLIVFMAILLMIDVYSKPKKSSKKSKGNSSHEETYSLPMNFKIDQDSYVAATILKTLGMKRVNLESLIVKFQRNCRNLNVVKSIHASIKKIRELTRSERAERKGFMFARKQLKSLLRYKRRNKNYRKKRPQYSKYRDLSRKKPIRSRRNILESNEIGMDFDSFKTHSRVSSLAGSKLSKGKAKKLSKLKKICASSGFYNAAVSRLKGTKQKLKEIKRNKLIRIIKTTLRRILSRILGCDFIRHGHLQKIVRKAMKKIITKNIEANVYTLTNMFKKISRNYRKRPRTIRKSRKIMRKVFSKLVRGKKIKPITLILVKKMAKNNCQAAGICYKYNMFSHKCFEVSKMCLNMKSVVKKIKANKVGFVVSTLIKKFISSVK